MLKKRVYGLVLDQSEGANAGIASDALKYVERKSEQLNTLGKIDERIEKIVPYLKQFLIHCNHHVQSSSIITFL